MRWVNFLPSYVQHYLWATRHSHTHTYTHSISAKSNWQMLTRWPLHIEAVRARKSTLVCVHSTIFFSLRTFINKCFLYIQRLYYTDKCFLVCTNWTVYRQIYLKSSAWKFDKKLYDELKKFKCHILIKSHTDFGWLCVTNNLRPISILTFCCRVLYFIHLYICMYVYVYIFSYINDGLLLI